MEKEESEPKATNFMEKLRWEINDQGDHVLVKRQERGLDEATIESSSQEINAYYSEYNRKQEFQNNLYSGQWVISELGKFEVTEKNETEVKLKTEGDPISIPLTEVKKDIKINITVISLKGVFNLGAITFDINDSYDNILQTVSSLTELPTKYLVLYNNKVEMNYDFHLYSLDHTAENKIEVLVKEIENICLKRSSSRDYSWYDKKFVIGFKTPASIRISAIGFYRHYETNLPITYEFYAYEVDSDKNKVLKSSLTDILVNNDNCDQSTLIRKVSIPPFIATPENRYLFYVYFGGDSNTRSYYAYSCSDNVTSDDGLKFVFSRETEEGHRTETYSGHVPHIYYDLCSIYA